MPKAIRFDHVGGPEVLRYVDVDVPDPAAGELQIRQHAVGLNFIDVYYRTGLYPSATPSGIGTEGAGEVIAVGSGVQGFKVGDRVAYAGGPAGAYAQVRNIPAGPVVKLPKSISYETAAAIMLKGMTTEYLLRRTYKVQKGQTILFHAAAGGVGLLACQWARELGVHLIGTAGTPEKAALARENGAEHVILYKTESVPDRVREITGGAMVPVVYDSVGKDTFQASIDSLQPWGLFVSFGNASGPVPPVPLTALKSTLYMTRPSLMPHIAKRDSLEELAAGLFRMVGSGRIKVTIAQRYPLAEAARAHQDLEGRRTTGATLLIP